MVMATFEEAACSNCNFWWNEECRRYAPKPAASFSGDGWMSDWPATDADDWCGEHQFVVEKA